MLGILVKMLRCHSRGDITCFVIVVLASELPSLRRCLAYNTKKGILIRPEGLITQSMLFGRIIEPVAGVTQPWRDETIYR